MSDRRVVPLPVLTSSLSSKIDMTSPPTSVLPTMGSSIGFGGSASRSGKNSFSNGQNANNGNNTTTPNASSTSESKANVKDDSNPKFWSIHIRHNDSKIRFYLFINK